MAETAYTTTREDCDRAVHEGACESRSSMHSRSRGRLAWLLALGLPGLVELTILWLYLLLMDARLRLLPYQLNRRLLAPDPAEGPELIPGIGFPPGRGLSSGHNPGGADRKYGPVTSMAVARLVRLVGLAARFIPRSGSSCLRRALVLRSCLRARGIPARMVYGVQVLEGALKVHAWVEASGYPLDPGNFTPFNRI